MSDSETLLFRIADALSEASLVGWQSLTNAERVFLLIWELEADVNNGGFNQYFFNSAGDHALDVPAALRSVGANTTATIVDRALQTFAGEFSADRNARQSVLERIDSDTEAFDPLDQEFYAYPDDLSSLLSTFVATHLSEIRGATP